MLRLISVFLVLVGAATAGAQEVRVAVVEPAGGDPMADRLREELERAGLIAVALVRPPRAEDGSVAGPSLDELRKSSDARAAFEVEDLDPRVRLVIPEPDGDQLLLRELSWDDSDPNAAAIVGVQAVELLRAGLIEAAAVDQRRGARMSLVELALARPTAPGSRPSVSIGPGLTQGTISAAPTSSLLLAGRLPVWGPIRTTASIQAGLTGTSWSERQGQVYFSATSADLGLCTLLASPDADWLPDAGAALAVSVRRLAHDPAPLFRPGDPKSIARPELRAKVGMTGPRLGRLAPRGDVILGISRPVEVRLEGARVGQWGPATLTFALSGDVVF